MFLAYLFVCNAIRFGRVVEAGPVLLLIGVELEAEAAAVPRVSTIVTTGFIGEVAAAVEIMAWRFKRQARRKGWDLARVWRDCPTSSRLLCANHKLRENISSLLQLRNERKVYAKNYYLTVKPKRLRTWSGVDASPLSD